MWKRGGGGDQKPGPMCAPGEGGRKQINPCAASCHLTRNLPEHPRRHLSAARDTRPCSLPLGLQLLRGLSWRRCPGEAGSRAWWSLKRHFVLSLCFSYLHFKNVWSTPNPPRMRHILLKAPFKPRVGTGLVLQMRLRVDWDFWWQGVETTTQTWLKGKRGAYWLV